MSGLSREPRLPASFPIFTASRPQLHGKRLNRKMLGKTCDPGMLLEERGGSSEWIVTLPGAWTEGTGGRDGVSTHVMACFQGELGRVSMRAGGHCAACTSSSTCGKLESGRCTSQGGRDFSLRDVNRASIW